MRQMQECAHKLIDLGIDKDEIHHNLFSSQPLRKLFISQKGDMMVESGSGIFLYRGSVKLAPLDKALYLLFLRHPEGINFSYLPDYREELMEIYKEGVAKDYWLDEVPQEVLDEMVERRTKQNR